MHYLEEEEKDARVKNRMMVDKVGEKYLNLVPKLKIRQLSTFEVIDGRDAIETLALTAANKLPCSPSARKTWGKGERKSVDEGMTLDKSSAEKG